MEGLALYLFKSALCTALFFGVYWCFLKNQTFFRFNRYFLIAGLLCAIFLPFYTYTYELKLNVLANQDSPALATPSAVQENYFIYYALIGYAMIACILLSRHVLGLIKIKQVINRSGFRSIKDCKLVNTPEFKSSFSVFNYIFFDTSEELSDAEKKMILRHELAHVKQRHWADLLLAQLFCTLQWFNPLAWWYLKVIRQNHEYLADEAVLQQGNSVAGYRAVLVNQYVGSRVFAISSSFYHYPQQRIKMLARPSSGWINKLAVFIVFPALAIFLWAFSEAEMVFQVPTITVATQKKANTASPANLQPATPSVSAKVKNKTSQVHQQKMISSSSAKPQGITVAKESTAPSKAKLEKTAPVDLQPDAKESEAITSSSPLIKPTPAKPLYFLDGLEINYDIRNINSDNIASIQVLKGENAVTAYGERGRNGVVLISTKSKSQPIAHGL